MSHQEIKETIFPKFEKFIKENDLLSKAKGSLSSKLPRILGQGKTKAVGLDLPPAIIERKTELISLTHSSDIEFPEEVLYEIEQVKQEVELENERLKSSDGLLNIIRDVFKNLSDTVGQKDNYYFAGRLVLLPKNRGQSWAWSITPYYPIIHKIPADVEYLVKAYTSANELIDKTILPVEIFEDRLRLAWAMARHFSDTDSVLVTDVARMFKIARQEERFWKTPSKRFFTDIPEAAFIANILNWRRQHGRPIAEFEFVRATLQQAHGANAKAFYLPQNPEGTQVTPIIYLKRHSQKET